jgi:transposase, IS6 family
MVTEGKKNPFEGRQFTAEIILWAVRWYLQFPISYRDLECMLSDRGVQVDHTTLFRWIQTYAPEIDRRIRPHLRMTNGSWRVDETYIRVKGEWVYLYRAVDAAGQTIDFLLSPKRDAGAARRFFHKALQQPHTVNPRTITVDKNAAYPIAARAMKKEGTLWRFAKLGQVKVLNNIEARSRYHQESSVVPRPMLEESCEHSALFIRAYPDHSEYPARPAPVINETSLLYQEAPARR